MNKHTKPRRNEMQVMYGDEPTVNDPTPLQLIKLLNWYSDVGDANKRPEWVAAWAKANGYTPKQASAMKRYSESILAPTWAHLCRAETSGSVLGKTTAKRLRDTMKQYMADCHDRARLSGDALADSANRMRQMVKARQEAAVGRIDEQVDRIFTGAKPEFDVLTAKESVDPAYKTALKRLSDAASEWDAALTKDDPDLAEGYAGIPRAIMKRAVKWALELTKGSSRKAAVHKALHHTARKSSKPQKSAGGTLTFGKGSKPASALVGAKIAWLYDQKNRNLARLEAVDADGLQAKGKSVINVKSTVKSVRKPEPALAVVARKGIRAVDDMFDHIRAKARPGNERFQTGERWIIVRVFE